MSDGDRPADRILRQRVDELDRDLQTTRTAVQGLADAITAMAVQAARVRPIHWPYLAADEHATRYSELLAWLRSVWVERYPMDTEALTECWWQHPAAVDLLTTAWQSWVSVYENPAASTDRQVAWQHTTRPTTTAQLRLVLGNCSSGRHVPDPHQPELITGGWG